ncbi:MAG: glycosyltransferase family 4 protein [Bacillota bacterium]
MNQQITAFMIAFVVTYLSTPIVSQLALKIGAVDQPNLRRINQHAVVNWGGLAIYLGFITAILTTLSLDLKLVGLIVGSTLILVVGLIDDYYELTPISKLIGQLAAALVVIKLGIKIEFITNPLGGVLSLGYFSLPLTIIWIVGITNTVNLIDGLDGLAAGIAAIAAVTLFIVAGQETNLMVMTLAVMIVGVCIGFLQYNFNPASIFMGDSGSLLLGFLLAVISIMGALKSAAAITLVIPVLALGVPIVDTLLAIIRRHYSGKSIFKADQSHLHHRLLELGLTQKETVIVLYLVSITLGLVAVMINGVAK